MNLAEKLRNAEALAERRGRHPRPAFPIASPGDFDSRPADRREGEGPVICGLAARPAAISCAPRGAGAGRAQAHPYLHQHQPLHMKYKLAHGAGDGAGGRWWTASRWRASTPTTWNGRPRRQPHRARLPLPLRRGRHPRRRTTINIPDTVGYALPADLGRIFSMLRERVPGAGEVIFSAHNHNTWGSRSPTPAASPRGAADRMHGERHRRARRQRRRWRRW